jgi:hypothetical protein
MKMNIKELRIAIITLYILTILVIVYPVAYPLIETNRDEFLMMTILGNKGTVENYFANSGSTIVIGEKVDWNIQLYDSMKEMVYLSIKIKILDFNASSPDVILCTPTDEPTIYQINKIMMEHDEVNMPFSWKIEEVIKSGDHYKIKSIVINDERVVTNFDMNKDMKLKLIFELWKYNVNNGQFEFKLFNDGDYMCIWNQINFKLNI